MWWTSGDAGNMLFLLVLFHAILQSSFCVTLDPTEIFIHLWFSVHQDLVDIDVFQEAKKVIDALQNKDVAPALAWCADNKSRLKKSKVYTAV